MYSLFLLKRPHLLRQLVLRKNRVHFPTAVVNLLGRNEVLNMKYSQVSWVKSKINEQEKTSVVSGTVNDKTI